MLWKNECGHPIEDYLFSITGPIDSYDVWYHRHSLGNKNEFCLRYGNEDHEYKSSWDCTWIERRISHLNKFAETPTDRMELIMFVNMKNKIQEKPKKQNKFSAVDFLLRIRRHDTENTQEMMRKRFKTI